MKILVTGASRGLGLEFCRQSLAAENEVMAVTREQSAELTALQKMNSNHLRIAEVDITRPGAADQVADQVEAWGGLDILINNAGIYCKGEKLEDFQLSYHLNAIVPFQLTRALLPFLRKSRSGKAIQITSLMGSIADNSSGGSYAYRSSKSALNMINKCFSVENDWLTTAVLHPGWVKTDMGGAGAPVEPEDSVRGLLTVIHELNHRDSGTFFDFRGKPLPW